MMWYWLANGLHATLTVLAGLGAIGVTYLAIQAVRHAYSDTHTH